MVGFSEVIDEWIQGISAHTKERIKIRNIDKRAGKKVVSNVEKHLSDATPSLNDTTEKGMKMQV